MLVDKLPMKLCGILGIFISTNLEILPVLGVITDELNAYNVLLRWVIPTLLLIIVQKSTLMVTSSPTL